MRRLIGQVAWALKWKTWYHIVYQFSVDGGTVTADCVVSVRPWLRQGAHFEELREYAKKVAAEHGGKDTPNIIGITKVGA